VSTPTDIDERIEIVKRRDAFDRDPHSFVEQYRETDDESRVHIEEARARVESIDVSEAMLRRAAELCIAVGTDGLRGELTLVRAARAYAALESASAITDSHLYKIALPALRHRLRKDPLDETSADARIDRALSERFGAAP
jgi:magnesium chelatase subunit I